MSTTNKGVIRSVFTVSIAYDLFGSRAHTFMTVFNSSAGIIFRRGGGSTPDIFAGTVQNREKPIGYPQI